MDTRSRSKTNQCLLSKKLVPHIISSPATELRSDLLETDAQIRKLVDDLKSTSIETQREAAGELRQLARHNVDKRIIIANLGAISLLLDLLISTDTKTQENAVTTLLNLSLNDNNITAIANGGCFEPFVHVLQAGSLEARENSAAALYSLSKFQENRVRIGKSGAIPPLVELLQTGTSRGKKDAVSALFNLSMSNENRAGIVEAGAVKHLVCLMDPATGLADKAVAAVLANLAAIPEGSEAIGQAGGIAVLVEVVELGSAKGKEFAAAALLQLCTNSNSLCRMVLKEDAVPPLMVLSWSGTPRAKEKAQQVLTYLRNQQRSNTRRG